MRTSHWVLLASAAMLAACGPATGGNPDGGGLTGNDAGEADGGGGGPFVGGPDGGAADGGPVIHAATCSPGCPAGYTCSVDHCVSGSSVGVTFDVKSRALWGTLAVRGDTPGGTCGAGTGATLVFTETSGDTITYAVPCNDVTAAPWPFSGRIYEGTYVVSATGHTPDSKLPLGQTAKLRTVTAAGDVNGLFLDVPSVHVAGTTTTTVQLRKPGADEDDAFFLVKAGSTFSGYVLPGTYDLRARGSASSPLGFYSTRLSPALDLTQDRTNLVVAPTTVSLSGSLTRNGAPPLLASSCTGNIDGARLLLRTSGGETSAELNLRCGGAGAPLLFSGNVPAGTYSAWVQDGLGTNDLPDLPVPLGTVTAAAGRPSVALDVRAYYAKGTLTLDGKAPTCTSASLAPELRFTSALGTSLPQRIFVECNGSFFVTLPDGDYQVTLVHPGTGSSLPTGTYPLPGLVGVHQENAVLALNVPSVSLAGTLTRDGTPLRVCGTDKRTATVQLRPSQGGPTTTIAAPCPAAGAPASFRGRVYPGTYDVWVESPEFGGAVPLQERWAVSSDQAALAWNVEAALITGVVTHNGAKPNGAISLSFESRQWRSPIVFPVLCPSASGPCAFSVRVPKGRYRAAITGDGTDLPAGPYAPFGWIDFQ